MMYLVRIVAGLHLAVYLGIMWYGWQSYKLLRKPSWKVMGIGFTILLVYRISEFAQQMIAPHPLDIEGTLIPFVASVFLLVAFRTLRGENEHVVELVKQMPARLMSGALPAEYWLENFRQIVLEGSEKMRLIVREEVTAALGALKLKTTTTPTE